MAKKAFFEKRTPKEMLQNLHVKNIYTPRSLVERIFDLDANSDGLQLRFPLIPRGFLRNPQQSQAAASRKHYKHGALIHIDQPETQQEAYDYPYIPLTARMKALDEAFHGLKEEEINFIGIVWHPVQSRDRRWRVVPFDVSLEGTKIYCYAVHRAGGIPLKDYTNAKVVEREGGQIIAEIPSRTKGRERYSLTLLNVPVLNTQEKKAIIWGLKSDFQSKEPERRTFLHHLRYEFGTGAKGSDIYVYTPHEVAGYLAVVKHCWNGLKNTVPLEMNPYPLPSKEFTAYYEKLNNNIMLYDPSLESKQKLRNLHLDEVCVMLGRAIKVKGPYSAVFWDPKRDGAIKNYWR